MRIEIRYLRKQAWVKASGGGCIFTFIFLTGSGPETGSTGERLNDNEKVGHLKNVIRCVNMRSTFMSSKNAWGCCTSNLESQAHFVLSHESTPSFFPPCIFLMKKVKLEVLRTISKLLQENQLIRQQLVELNKTRWCWTGTAAGHRPSISSPVIIRVKIHYWCKCLVPSVWKIEKATWCNGMVWLVICFRPRSVVL